MRDTDYLNLFFENPMLLLDSCRAVIEHIESSSTKSAEIKAQEIQLKEISHSIERLEKVGVPVPDILRGEKTRLAASLAIETNEKQLLTNFANELEKILIDLKTRIINPENNSDVKVSKILKRRHSNSQVTDRKTIRKHILIALKKLGGCATATEVMDEIEKQLEGRFLPGDLVYHKDRRTTNLRDHASMERRIMVKKGILKNDSPRGVWELSEEYL